MASASSDSPSSGNYDWGTPPPEPNWHGGSRGEVTLDTEFGMPSIPVPDGPRSTMRIMKLLEAKKVRAEETRKILAPFPVVGTALYINDWRAPRYTPKYHLHEGTDIFAMRGTPVVAVMAGEVTRVTRSSSAVGGKSVWTTGIDGTGFYFAHLDEVADRLAVGDRLREGDLIGSVGSTGNARGGLPHLHFEIRPKMGEPVPPVPHLDRWLHEAMVEAQGLPGGDAAARLTGAVPGVGGWSSAGVDKAALGELANLSVAEVDNAASSRSDSAGTWLTLLSFALLGAIVLIQRRRRHLAPDSVSSSSAGGFELILARVGDDDRLGSRRTLRRTVGLTLRACRSELSQHLLRRLRGRRIG